MKKIFFVILVFICLCGCNKPEQEVSRTITLDQIKDMMIDNEYIIIDVRTKEEYDVKHIKDSINIPYNEIDQNIDVDKNKIIFVYCKSGNRSKIAYDVLNKLGYNVYDLGGLDSIDLEKE